MSGDRKTFTGRRKGQMHVVNVGPCFTCGFRNVCWFAGLGWDAVNHVGGALSDFQEPPCRRLKAVPTMPSDRVVPPTGQTRRIRKARQQSHSTPAGPTHRPAGSTDSD